MNVAAQRSGQELQQQNQTHEHSNTQSYSRLIQPKTSRPQNGPPHSKVPSREGSQARPIPKGTSRNTSSSDDHSKQKRPLKVPSLKSPLNNSGQFKQLAKNQGPNRAEEYNSKSHNSWNPNQMAESNGLDRPEQYNSESHDSWNHNQNPNRAEKYISGSHHSWNPNQMAKNQGHTRPEQYNPGSHNSWNHNQMSKNNGPSNGFEQYNSLNHNSWNINDKAENKGTYRPKQPDSESQHPWNSNQYSKHGPNQKFPPQAPRSQEYLDSRLNSSNQQNHHGHRNNLPNLGSNQKFLPQSSKAQKHLHPRLNKLNQPNHRSNPLGPNKKFPPQASKSQKRLYPTLNNSNQPNHRSNLQILGPNQLNHRSNLQKLGPNQKFSPQASESQEYLHPMLNNSNQPNHFDDQISPQMLGANAIPLLSRASRFDGIKNLQNGALQGLNKWVDNCLSNNQKPNTAPNGFSDVNNLQFSAQHSVGSKSPTPSLEPASKKRKTFPGESSFETKLDKERSLTPPQRSGLFIPEFSLLESPYHEKSSIIEGSPNGKVEGVEFVIDTEPHPAGSKYAKDKSKFSFLKQLAKTSHDLESSADGSHEEKYDNPARHLKPLPDFVSLADIDNSASFVTRVPDTDSSKTPLAPHFSV